MVFTAIPREKVLAAIAKVGPLQPLDLRRELQEGDTVLLGAILSEMASSGKVAISKTRRGGGPFYYDPANPASLEKLSEFLGEKDHRTYDLLKEQQVLREDELDPLTRVSLRNIPDFSRRFLVRDGEAEIGYWRYYLLSEDEARARLAPAPELPKEEPVQEPAIEELPQAEPEPVEVEAAQPQKEAPEEQHTLLEGDPLFSKVRRFLSNEGATIRKYEQIKEGAELHCTISMNAAFGKQQMFVLALSRKTLPEQMVWSALLEARSNGMPLLVLKDSPFPKSLPKKFEDVPNVWFKKI